MKTLSLTAIIVFLVDQMTKYLAFSSNQAQINEGVAFGWLSGLSLTLVVVMAFILLMFLLGKSWLVAPFFSGLLIGGTLSNILDRFTYHGVVDWLSLPFINLQNNLADWTIVIGLFGLILNTRKLRDAS